jgi:hypothetical protein
MVEIARTATPSKGGQQHELYGRARTAVTASRTAVHDSGPVGVVTPSPYDAFVHNTSPV